MIERDDAMWAIKRSEPGQFWQSGILMSHQSHRLDLVQGSLHHS
jgi:hypothetical protein